MSSLKSPIEIDGYPYELPVDENILNVIFKYKREFKINDLVFNFEDDNIIASTNNMKYLVHGLPDGIYFNITNLFCDKPTVTFRTTQTNGKFVDHIVKLLKGNKLLKLNNEKKCQIESLKSTEKKITSNDLYYVNIEEMNKILDDNMEQISSGTCTCPFLIMPRKCSHGMKCRYKEQNKCSFRHISLPDETVNLLPIKIYSKTNNNLICVRGVYCTNESCRAKLYHARTEKDSPCNQRNIFEIAKKYHKSHGQWFYDLRKQRLP